MSLKVASLNIQYLNFETWTSNHPTLPIFTFAINVGSLALSFLSHFPCVDNLRHLLLLAMKPGFGQQLSRRAAFGADTLLG
jgi:hypothetical protein